MDPAIRLLRDLVAINSVNPTLVPGAPGEAEIAAAVATAMRDFGLDVQTQQVAPGRPNTIGVLEGRRNGRTLMFCGHVDTVGVAGMTQPFAPYEKDGRLYGRGAQDMKSGVAAMIDATRVLAETGGLESGRVVVAAVVDEEHSSIGADALVTAWTADAAVVTEPTSLEIAVGHKGFAWIDVEVHGRAAHGSRPADGEDAILRMGRVLQRLEELDRELQARAPHPLLGTGSLHASTIEGGRELSSYPDRARLQMERRTLPDEPASTALGEVESILERLRREDSTFRGEARGMFSRPAYELAADHELPQTLAGALLHISAARPPVAATAGAGSRTRPTRVPSQRMVGMSFWTDAAVLGHAGIPSILFGPGGAGLHSTQEFATIADVLVCRDALVELARRFCQAV
jgi:acetylornithine deacetylase